MMKIKCSKIFTLTICAIMGAGGLVFAFLPTEKISMDMNSRTLQHGQYVTIKGEVYYRTNGGRMVTHVTSPFEQVIITDAIGEMKTFDKQSNTVMLVRGDDYSSKESFIYQFLSGNINDMGLPELGLKIGSTKLEDGAVVNTWVLKQNGAKGAVQKVIVAHQNNLPVYMAFYKEKNVPVQKVYYTNYTRVGSTMMPMNFTEINFEKDGKDSVITRRLYSNLKLNHDVVDTYLDFAIPSSAKLITEEDIKKATTTKK
jgi:outer membrane lipoprotein-sorting protein